MIDFQKTCIVNFLYSLILKKFSNNLLFLAPNRQFQNKFIELKWI
jgi:hypothetical protein